MPTSTDGEAVADDGASFAIVDLLLSAGIVAYQRGLARAVGDHSAGLLLSQFWYWAERQPEVRDGWFYMTQDQIQEETVMTRREQETARRKLRDLGLLEEKKEGLPAKLWYRVNRQAVVSLLRETALQSRKASIEDRPADRTTKDGGKRHTRMAESANQDSPKTPDLPGGKRPTITKSSSKTSPDITFSSTLNVGGAAYKKLILDPVIQVERITSDSESRHRYVQLREICLQNSVDDAWVAALRSTQSRMRRDDQEPLERPGAWFDKALVRELDKRGIAVPTKAEKAEAPCIRGMIGASLGLVENDALENAGMRDRS